LKWFNDQDLGAFPWGFGFTLYSRICSFIVVIFFYCMMGIFLHVLASSLIFCVVIAFKPWVGSIRSFMPPWELASVSNTFQATILCVYQVWDWHHYKWCTLNNIIHEPQTLHPNEILWGGPNFTIIWACCVASDLVVDLTIGTCRFQFIASSYNLVFDLCYLCSNFLFFIHAKFPRTSIKTCWGVNKHILVLEGDKKLFECVLKPMAIVCLHDNHGFAQLHVETPWFWLWWWWWWHVQCHTSQASRFIL